MNEFLQKYFSHGNVKILNHEDFNLNDGSLNVEFPDRDLIYVMVGSSNCPHCHQAAPKFTSVANDIVIDTNEDNNSKKLPIMLGVVQADNRELFPEDTIQRIAEQYGGINGVPAFLVYNNQGQFLNFSEPETRTKAGFKKAIKQEIKAIKHNLKAIKYMTKGM